MNMELARSARVEMPVDGILPVVIWEGFETVPAPDSAMFRSIAMLRPDAATFADPNVLVVVKRANAIQAEGLLLRLEEGREGLFRPQVFIVENEASIDVGQIEAQVRRVMAARYSALARRNTDLTRQLFEVRRVHEDLQAAFELVENYLHVNELNEPKLLMELPPSQIEGEMPVLRIEADVPVVLGLPFELNKIAGFSINVRRRRSMPASMARLLVKMASGTADEVYGSWAIPVEHLPESGWFSFLLDKLSIDYGHSIRISFQLDGKADVALAMTAKPLLGASVMPSLDTEADETGICRLPALRLWRGLPGTRMSHSVELQPFGFEDHGESRSTQVIPLAITDATVEQVFTTDASSAPLVSAHAEDRSVQVHPAPTGLVVAMVQSPLPRKQCRVQAVVGMHHEQASAVEFAMVAAGTLEDAVSQLSGNQGSATAIWVLADAINHECVEIECDPSENERNLYLATRLPEGGTTKYAWSRFRNIKVMV
jgi:hypothetical protein